MDIVDVETRSRMMSTIRGKDTQPEITIRRALHAAGFRYRLHDKSLPGKPDLVLRKYNASIFVNGCFWHRHPGCRYATTPTTRTAFWQKKFVSNVKRDELNAKAIVKAGLRVAIVWECALRKDKAEQTLSDLVTWLGSHDITSKIIKSFD